MTNTVHNTQVAIRGIEALATQAKQKNLFTKAEKIKINTLITLMDGTMTLYMKALDLKKPKVKEIEFLQMIVLKLSELITVWPENGENEKARIIKLIKRIEAKITGRFELIETGDYIM